MVYRTEIETALDEMISNEEGIRFQRMVIILAKQKWPDLIACEPKKDQGRDSYTPVSLAADGIGKVLACSITATIGKIKGDASSVKKYYNDIKVLIFATPVKKVTNPKVAKWAKEILDEFGYELIVIPREDIISSLMLPSNASICRTELGISIPIEASVEDLIEQAQHASSELTANWLANPRLAGRPHINLHTVKLDQKGKETSEKLNLESIQTELLAGRRIVLEAPAGRGKTTTLIQLAKQTERANALAFLIDLPAWAKSRLSILDFIAQMPPFLSRNIDAGNLARIHQDTQFLFLLNGWNEISKNYSDDAVTALRELERNFPKAGLIVATRNHHISPPLPGAFRTKLLSLDRKQRTEYLHQALGIRADELSLMLDTNPVLDALTRTPFILSEVTTIFKAGGEIPPTKIGVLGEVIRLLEQSEEHQSHLHAAPLRGHASEYLTELAVKMSECGDTTIDEKDARPLVNSVSKRLIDDGQIATLPEPASVLNTLCAHHILERLDYPSVAFRFEHQQFQEFYAASFLKQQLNELASIDNHDRSQAFTKRYLNEPVWDEPLRMIAEEIGVQSANLTVESNEVKTGELLIKMALNVDPIFAATLSQLCGKIVWSQVRSDVAGYLRSWYAVDDENHQQCAVAGMLATGSDDFSDIILPLLANKDQQVRLGTYRAGKEFYLSSLGTNWRNVVKGWEEEARYDFVTEMTRDQLMLEISEDFALFDPSLRIRVEAVRMLNWVGADQEFARLLGVLDGEGFEKAIREIDVEMIPLSLRPRALGVYQKLLNASEGALGRLRILLCAAELGDTSTTERLKRELTQLEPGKISDSGEFVIEPALKIVQKTEPEWISHWVAERIVNGSLWRERWINLVTTIPDDLKNSLLEKISSEDLQHNQSSGIIAVLAATGDPAFVEAVFVKLCDIRRSFSDEIGRRNESKKEIVRQLENLLRALPPNVVVKGLENCLSHEYDIIEFTSLIEVFSSNGREKTDLREQLQDDLRQKLRGYLKHSVPWVLRQDDFTGEVKVNLASALSRVGEPEDMQDLQLLVWADIERVRKGMAARARGEQNESAKYCMTWFDHWHVAAIVSLDSVSAETLLLEVLCEWDYESSAASALVRLAKIKNIDDEYYYKKDYRIVWEARAGNPSKHYDEERRQRYAVALRQRVSSLLEERASSDQPRNYDFRLKDLSIRLASLDSQNSAELVLQVMALPGEWDGYKRCEALDALLFGGAKLPTETSLMVLNPTIEYLCAKGLYNDEQKGALKRCLCLLPFVDTPFIGIARIREVLKATELPAYELREIVTALGFSQCQEALNLLREIATTYGNDLNQMSEEWVNAVATLGGTDSKKILLSFIDPNADELPIRWDDNGFGIEGLLVSRLADLAQAETEIKQRVFQFCDMQLTSKNRHLLSKLIAKLGTVDAILAGLKLIDDNDTERIPFDLWRAIETVFIERRDGKTQNSYTLLSRSSNEVREKLFEMTLQDVRWKRSAFQLLGQIEVWRLEHGRPSTEPRHPDYDSGESWPLSISN